MLRRFIFHIFYNVPNRYSFHNVIIIFYLDCHFYIHGAYQSVIFFRTDSHQRPQSRMFLKTESCNIPILNLVDSNIFLKYLFIFLFNRILGMASCKMPAKVLMPRYIFLFVEFCVNLLIKFVPILSHFC